MAGVYCDGECGACEYLRTDKCSHEFYASSKPISDAYDELRRERLRGSLNSKYDCDYSLRTDLSPFDD